MDESSRRGGLWLRWSQGDLGAQRRYGASGEGWSPVPPRDKAPWARYCTAVAAGRGTRHLGAPATPTKAGGEPRPTRALRMVHTSFSAKVALSFDQPSKVARWQSVGRAIWRDREAQPEESGCRPGQDPEGMGAETGDSEISPTGTGLSEPRGPS